jgi:hypothetical protein
LVCDPRAREGERIAARSEERAWARPAALGVATAAGKNNALCRASGNDAEYPPVGFSGRIGVEGTRRSNMVRQQRVFA